MDIPNFDAMTQDDLRTFWSKWHGTTEKKAVELTGERKDARQITETLACYAINKSCAIGLRLDGKINQALGYESDCQRIYELLPADVRW